MDRIFEISDLSTLDAITNSVAMGNPDSEVTLQHTFLDTFDWRLFRSDRALAHTVENGQQTLNLWQLKSGDKIASIPVDSIPFDTLDLSAYPPMQSAARIIGIRSLVRHGTVDAQRSSFMLKNRDDKTVVRMHFTRNRLSAENSRHTLEIVPVKGYDRQCLMVTKDILDATSLSPAIEPISVSAYQARHLQPGSYSGKLELQFDRQTPLPQVLANFYRTGLEVLDANIEGIQKRWDTEFLHDFRITVRRARAALPLVRSFLTKESFEKLRVCLQKLQRYSGAARDADVYLLDFAHYTGLVAPSLRSHLTPLRKIIEQRQKRAYSSLNRILRKTAWQQTQQIINAAIEALAATQSGPEAAVDLGQRIVKQYRKTIKMGRAIDQHSPDESLHELRKECKKLRYLQELAAPITLLEAKQLTKENVKPMQKVLGEFQDYCVQIETIFELSNALTGPKTAAKHRYMACGALINSLDKMRVEARQRFAEVFEEYQGIENSMKRLFLVGGNQ